MPLFSGLKKHWNWSRIKNNIEYLIKYDLMDEKYRLKDETIEDCIYEFEELKETLPKLHVLNETETVELLSKSPKSFARYGDGEIAIMRGENAGFQDYDPELARKMKDILVRKRDNLYVGLNCSYFQSPIKYSARNRKYYRLYGTEFRRYFNTLCDPENLYLDACCFGGYFRQGDQFDLDAHFRAVRDLFQGKKIAIVCGEGILDSLEYDLFDLSAERQVIYAPKKNAFSCYEKILEDIRKSVSKDTLVCIILGMTATVLAADLADEGYLAWDIGHAAKDYDAFMRKLDKTEDVAQKFFSPD